MNGLHIEKLSANVRGKKYLDKVTLDVDRNEAVALVGKGSDRRLLMRIARECIRDKIGIIDNEDVIARIESGEGTLVIEGDNLYDFMTLKQYMLYCAGAVKMSRIEKLDRIIDCLELTGLDGKWKDKISNLSRTEKCMLSIANGMFSAPEVLMLCLDELRYTKEVADRLNDVIERIKNKGVAVLASVNDSRLVGEGFDRIVLMADGRVVEHGTSEDIIAKYSYCVYAVKAAGNIKKLADKFSQLRSVIKVKPRGEKIYLYTLDKERTSRDMLEVIGEGGVEELRMINPSLKDALARAGERKKVSGQ